MNPAGGGGDPLYDTLAFHASGTAVCEKDTSVGMLQFGCILLYQNKLLKSKSTLPMAA